MGWPRLGARLGAVAASFGLLACADKLPSNATVVRLLVVPPVVTMLPNSDTLFVAFGQSSTGDTGTVTATWSASGGSVTAQGRYTAPAAQGTFYVKATRGALADSAQVTVDSAPVVRIVISPKTDTVTAGDTVHFVAKGIDSLADTVPVTVLWSASGGTMDLTGTWHSPTTAGQYTIRATNGALRDSASVLVNASPIVKIVVSPKTDTVPVGDSIHFVAKGVNALSDTVAVSVLWSASGGTIDATGLWHAPAAAGQYVIRAASGALTDSASVVVRAAPVVKIVVAPKTVSVTAGDTVRFTAKGLDSLSDTLAVAVVWTATGGTMDPTGTWHSPATLGQYYIKAADGALRDSATATVDTVTPAFVDNFESGALSADQNGYGWSFTPVSRVTVSTDRGVGGSTHSLKFDYGPDGLGELPTVTGVGANGSFTRSSGTWTANEWLLTPNKAIWAFKADSSLCSGSPFVVTSNDATHVYFTGDATGAVYVTGESLNGNQGSVEANFHFGAYLTEVWLEYEWFIPANYIQRLHTTTGAAGANNKNLSMWRDVYSGTSDFEFVIENYPNVVGNNPNFTADGTTRIRVLATKSTDGSVTDIPSPQLTANPNYITPTGPVIIGQWNQMRIHVKSSSNFGVANGVAEIWANGTLIFQKTDGTFYGVTPPPTHLDLHNGYLMGPSNSGYTVETDFYIDNFKIYDRNPGW